MNSEDFKLIMVDFRKKKKEGSITYEKTKREKQLTRLLGLYNELKKDCWKSDYSPEFDKFVYEIEKSLIRAFKKIHNL